MYGYSNDSKTGGQEVMAWQSMLGSAVGGEFQSWMQTGMRYERAKEADRIAKYNARILNQYARAEEQVMEYETAKMTKAARRLKAKQLALYGKSGAVVTEGTPLAVQAKQAGDIQMDILMQRRNRMIRAQQLRHQAYLMRF